MKSNLLFTFLLLVTSVLFISCGSSQSLYLDLSSPEEIGLNLIKITDETNGNVIAGSSGQLNYSVDYAKAQCGFNKEQKYRWGCYPCLQVSL